MATIDSISWNGVSEALTSAEVTKSIPLPLEDGIVSRVYEIDPLRDPRWAQFVERHPRAGVFHTTKWLSTLHNVYGYKPVAVTTSAADTPLTNGLVFCEVNSWLTGSRLVSLPFSDHCEPLVESRQQGDHLLTYLRHYLDGGSCKYIEVRPVSIEPGECTQYGPHLTYCLHRLDLKRSPQELFKSFHKDCVQRKIRRAEREGVKYENGPAEALVDKFYRLLVLTRQRHSLPPQPRRWFEELVAQFGSDLRIRVASYGDVPVASILTLRHKKIVTYKYGCSDTRYNRLGPTALLFWNAIQEAQSEGHEEFDLGRSDYDNLGLIAFKNHWGAVLTSLTYWKAPHEPKTASTIWQRQFVQQAVSAIPKPLLELAGKLFYRHIG